MSAPVIQIASLRESIHDETSPLQVAEFLISQMLTKPDGALYAQWDDKRHEVIWYYSSDHAAIFRLPEEKEPILRQTVRGIFRSVVFRLGHGAAEERDFVPLCGFYFLEHARDGRPTRRRVMVHADFLPEYGVWIKATFLTVKSEPDGSANRSQPVGRERNQASSAAGSGG